MIKNELKRYTNLPSLFHILKTQKLTLLDPNSWDDSNDTHCMSVYKQRRRLKTLLALCFTETSETYHHWHIFAKDSSGVCLTFDKDLLLSSLDPTLGFVHGSVSYHSIQDLRDNPPKLKELPYIKRLAYSDEKEYRILYLNGKKAEKSKSFPFSIDCIRKITLSPWLHQSLLPSVKETVRGITMSDRLNQHIVRSTLTGNKEWKEIAETAKG